MRYGARSGKGCVDVDGTDGVDPSISRNGANRIVQIRRHPWTTRRRGGGGPAGAKGQSGQGDPDRSAGSGGSPFLRQLRLQQTRRARTRRRTRARGGVLHPVRHTVLLCSQAFSRRPGRRAVRSARLHRPRRPRLDLPGHRPQRPQPLGGAQGSRALRRRRRDGHRCRRSPRPRRGGTPQHRPDPQLRRAQGFGRHDGRLHRHGVRRRDIAQADPPGARRSSATRPGGRLHRRDRAGARLPARRRPGLLRLQAGQRDAERRAAQAHRPRCHRRHGRRLRCHLRNPRLSGARDRLDRPYRRQRRLHRRADSRGSRHGLPAGERPLHRAAARARRRPGVRATRVVVPRHPSRHRLRIPSGASRRWTSSPTS